MKLFNILKNKTAKDSIFTLTGNLISQALSLFVVAIVSRFLSVTDYGIYSILNNISSFVQDMADMGMNGAITRFVAEFRAKNELEKENQVICYSLRRKLLNLIFVFIVLVSFSKPIASYWLHDSSKYHYIYLIILTCAFSLLVSALRAILQGKLEFKNYFISVVTWNFVWAATITIMAFTNNLTVVSSIIAGVVSGVINLFLCVKLVKLDMKQVICAPNIDLDTKKKFNNFGNWMLLWSMFAVLQSKLDVFMLASFTTPEQVSYYDIASKVIKPILMVVSAYAQVLNPQFASIKKSEMKHRITIIVKFIGIISVLIVVAIIMVGPVINIVFGNKYNNSILPAQMLLFAIIFYVWTVPFNSALYALNKPYIFTLAAFIGLIVTGIGNYLLLGKYGVIGAAFTYIAAQVVGLIVALLSYIIIVRKEVYHE